MSCALTRAVRVLRVHVLAAAALNKGVAGTEKRLAGKRLL